MPDQYYLLFSDHPGPELDRALDEVLAADGWSPDAGTSPAQRSFELVALPGDPAGVAIRGPAPLFDALAAPLSRRLGAVVVDPRHRGIDPCLGWVDGKPGDTPLASKVLARDDDDEQLSELPATRTYHHRATVLPLPAQAYFRDALAAARRGDRADLAGLGKVRFRPDGRVSFMASQALKNALQARRADGLGDQVPGLGPALAQLVATHEDILLCDDAVLYAYEIPAGELTPPGADEPVAVAARIAADLHVTRG